MNQKVILACDVSIYGIVKDVIDILRKHGWQIIDASETEVITEFTRSAEIVAEAVQKGEYDRGIVFCGSGMGVCIAANKFEGIRAALAYDVLPAALAQADDNTNVLCTGAWMAENAEKCAKMIETWLMCGYGGGHRAEQNVKLKVFIASDGQGTELKENVYKALKETGSDITDVSAEKESGSETARRVCTAIQKGDCDRGILVSAAGQDMNIAANKMKGIRSAICFDSYTARLSRVDTKTNVLCLSSYGSGAQDAITVAKVFLTTAYYGNNKAGLLEFERFEGDKKRA